MPRIINDKKYANVLLLFVSGILLQACASANDAKLKSLTGGCNTFPRPDYQIKGKTSYDQQWADETTESGVIACKWDRPENRPATLDTAPTIIPKEPGKNTLATSEPQDQHKNTLRLWWAKFIGWFGW